MPVELPDINPKRQLARKVADALASQIPLLGGPMAAIYSLTHPAKADQLQQAWQAKITESVNDIEATVSQLVPTVKITEAAAAVGVWVSRNSSDGRVGTSIEFSSLQEAFPDATKLELEDACGELELHGLLTLRGAVGAKIFLVQPTTTLFQAFDPVAFPDANPRADAAHLARYVLETDDGVRASDMLDHFGWSRRRLNPALSIISEMIGEGGQSREINREFVTKYVRPQSRDRAALRQFADTVLGLPEAMT